MSEAILHKLCEISSHMPMPDVEKGFMWRGMFVRYHCVFNEHRYFVAQFTVTEGDERFVLTYSQELCDLTTEGSDSIHLKLLMLS